MPSNSNAEKDLQTCSADLKKGLSAQEIFFFFPIILAELKKDITSLLTFQYLA